MTESDPVYALNYSNGDPVHFVVPEKGREEAATHIYEAFERYSTTVRSAAICNDYFASQQWENALRNCDEYAPLGARKVGWNKPDHFLILK